MYDAQVEKFSSQAAEKLNVFAQRPAAIWVGGMLAGAYVGIGIILIMMLGNDVPPEFRTLVMGATFAIALMLVMFAGAELFTGYTMYTTFGVLRKRMTISSAVRLCAAIWLGNLLRAVLLALMYKLGGGVLTKSADTVLQLIAHKKMNASAVQLFFNGVLCNWLVCLAIWMAARMNSDAAKCVGIFWCLFGFIASGYEHSVANMTVFSLALVGPEVEGINFVGAGFNLLWVTLGNTVSGVLFVGMSYWYMSKPVDVVMAEVVEGKRP
ncbi:formate/nitrite transporter family protein [Vibrio splendidus]